MSRRSRQRYCSGLECEHHSDVQTSEPRGAAVGWIGRYREESIVPRQVDAITEVEPGVERQSCQLVGSFVRRFPNGKLTGGQLLHLFRSTVGDRYDNAILVFHDSEHESGARFWARNITRPLRKSTPDNIARIGCLPHRRPRHRRDRVFRTLPLGSIGCATLRTWARSLLESGPSSGS